MGRNLHVRSIISWAGHLYAGVMAAWGLRMGTWMVDCPRIWILAVRSVLSCFESESPLQFVPDYLSNVQYLASFRVPRYEISDRVPENIHSQRHAKCITQKSITSSLETVHSHHRPPCLSVKNLASYCVYVVTLHVCCYSHRVFHAHVMYFTPRRRNADSA